MTRTALLTAVLVGLAACSGDSAEPAQSLATARPTTTAEAPPTQAPTAPTPTAPTSTTTTSTTTSVPDTTSTTSEVETSTSAPPDTIDPAVVAEIDALAAEAFVDYEATWLVIRAAFEDPSNAALREQLEAAYVDGAGGGFIEVLDEQVESGSITLPPEDGQQRVNILRSIGGAGEVFAVFQVCETLSASIVDATTGQPTYEGVDSYLKEVQMMNEADAWLIFRTTTLEEFEGATCDP